MTCQQGDCRIASSDLPLATPNSVVCAQIFCILTIAYGGWLVHNRSVYAELLAPSLYVDVGRIMIVVGIIR